MPSRRRGLGSCVALWMLSVIAACSSPAHPDVAIDASDGPAYDIALDARDAPDVLADVAVDAGPCTTDLDCSDGVFCNGIERCMPGAANADGRGCAPGGPATPCLTDQRCDEAMQRCVTVCPHAPDADGDGHRSTDCGGDDCDDSDANRFPGNPEVCDSSNHDEDCDARTFGYRDIDMDMYVDGQCCNMDGTTPRCGDDCNDSRANVHPSLAESCDGLDNNCDGASDEGVTRTFYPDVDGDGFGNSTAPMSSWMTGCVPAPHFSETGTDCNDTDAAVHPGALEQCDAANVDENCDGTANPSTLCACSGDITRRCTTLSGVCAAGTERCIAGSWGLCSIAPTTETCNGLDDDCDGSTDESLSVTCYPDADNDGYAVGGAASAQVCPVPGRDGFAGCPPNQTNRPPIGTTAVDCNDSNSTVNPGAAELCDAALVDEDCNGISNPPTLCACTDGDTRPCTASGSCGAGNQVCSGGRFSACSVNPVTESCNAVDDDCDGSIDEGLTVTCYADNDNDGYAASSAVALQSCPVAGRDGVGGCPTNQTNRAPSGTAIDCNDTNSSVSPGAVELCDAGSVDEDCDGTGNPASLCACSGTVMRQCTLAGACAAGTQTCNGGSWSNCSITPVGESCNNIDDNCNGTIDEGLSVTCYPDADNDGFAVAGATTVTSCPVAGREAVGGCPTYQTNRAPTGTNVDCNDTAAAVHPGATEVCDGGGVDENCDGTADPPTLCACTGTASRTCPMRGACAAGTQMCLSGNWSVCSVQPVPEVCNSIDDDCNGQIDDNVSVACFTDADNDTYPASGATAAPYCPVAGRVAFGGCPGGTTNRVPTTANIDCNDSDGTVNPAAAEVCDAALRDENCDGTSNPISLCTCSGTASRPCAQPGACAAGTQTCSSGQWGLCSVQPIPEACNAADDNCNGVTDEGVTVTCYSDADGDMFAPSGTTGTAQCPVVGRDAVGGCPSGFTNRAPASASIDCLDTNATVNPLTVEVCNGADDNCNGAIDEGVSVTCYTDTDNDTFAPAGSAGATQCPVAGRGAAGGCPSATTNRAPTTGATDCLDANGSAFPGAPEVCNGVDDNCSGTVDEGTTVTCYPDVDNDTYAAAGAASSPQCPNATRGAVGGCPVGYTNRSPATAVDCSDTSAAQNPAQPEVCNAVDDNCNGTVDEGTTVTCYVDGDNDTYALLSAGAVSRCPVSGRASVGGCDVGYTNRPPATAADCTDTNAAQNPGQVEVCNALDDNCNGAADEGTTVTCFVDADNDTYALASALAVNRCPVPGRASVGGCDVGYTNRSPATASDCADTSAAQNPGQVEVCNGIDDNCTGGVDEGVTTTFHRDADGDGYGALTPTQSACTAPPGYVANSLDCDDASTSRNPASSEVCDGVDNDCDGSIDEGVAQVYYRDADGDGFGNPALPSSMSCGANPGYSRVAGDCDDANAARSPGAAEACNGLDDNCNGVLDGANEDDDRDGYADTACGAACSGSCGDCSDLRPDVHPGAVEICDGVDSNCNAALDGPGEDDDGDLHADRACADAAGNDCDDANPAIYAGAAELCNNVDNNCDGIIAEDADGDGHASTASTCSGGPLPKDDCNDANVAAYAGRPEVCDGVDNDCDALTDEAPEAPASCIRTNAVSVCNAGRCAVNCNFGFGDCDGNGANGCEANLSNNPNHCGGCGVACSPGDSCIAGICSLPRQVAGGSAFTCALYTSGSVGCWGSNSYGQLCTGNITSSTTPVAAVGLSNVAEIALGGAHGCARRNDGTVWCWGANQSGQLGDGSTTTRLSPVQVPGITDAVRISARDGNTCAVRATGQVLCWGNNVSGQLGIGTTLASATPVAPTTAPGVEITGAIDVAVGGTHACALTPTTMYCWGSNRFGQIGDGTMTDRLRGVPIAWSAFGVVRIGAGYFNTCRLTGAGAHMECWGLNTHGEAGRGGDTTVPADTGAAGVIDFGMTDFSTCARNTVTVSCWGQNNNGELGNGTTTNSMSAVLVTGLTDASAISTGGGGHTCALRPRGRIDCWGSNASSQLGNGGTGNATTPRSVSLPANVADVFAGGMDSCVRRTYGVVECWGDNGGCSIPNGVDCNQRPSPTAIASLSDAAQATMGSRFGCALRSNGTVVCWGANDSGQLGDGTLVASTSPVTVSGLSGAVQVSAGTDHACALRSNGAVVCWGQAASGQLGNGALSRSSVPVAVSGLTDAVQISVNAARSCARRANGSVVCWGSGALGDGGLAQSAVPVAVSNLQDAVQLTTGGNAFSCALRSTGAVSCWGVAGFGQLGDGSSVDQLTPANVSGLTDALSVSAGQADACALRASGATVCWGQNAYGSNGDGSFIAHSTPVSVAALLAARQVSMGSGHTCAMTSARGAMCWGFNSSGQLGDGTMTNSAIPLNVPGIP